jgi:hypothetical protein
VYVNVPEKEYALWAVPDSRGGDPVLEVYSNRDDLLSALNRYQQSHPQFRQQQPAAAAYGMQDGHL